MYLITWITTHLYRPLRDKWLSWPCWLTDSGRLTHKVIIRPASSLTQDRESSPVKDQRSTTVLRRQLATPNRKMAKRNLKHRNSRELTIMPVIQMNNQNCCLIFISVNNCLILAVIKSNNRSENYNATNTLNILFAVYST